MQVVEMLLAINQEVEEKEEKVKPDLEEGKDSKICDLRMRVSYLLFVRLSKYKLISGFQLLD